MAPNQDNTSEEEICARVGKCLSSRREVVCAYVFGSTLNQPRKARDLDVAVLIDRELTGGDILPATVRLFDLLKAELDRTDIDVVPLNDASHLLRHEVISNGRCVYARSESERVEFETKAEIAYYDFQPIQRIFDEATLQQILEEEA